MEAWINIGFRTLGFFLLLIIVVPLMGRKPISSMTFFDYIAGLAAGLMVALIALNVVENLSLGMFALALWLLAIAAVTFGSQKSKWIHDHINGKEITVIKEGKIMEENLQSTRITADELLAQLRKKNIFQLADVEFAVIEANGDISVLLKREKQPLSPKGIGVEVSTIKEPQTVIMDGNIIDEHLAALGLNRNWLETELNKAGVSKANVFIAQADSMGELYIDLFDDSIELPKPTAKELLMTTLKKAEADFYTYALETQNDDWKGKYQKYAAEIHDVSRRLEPHLKN